MIQSPAFIVFWVFTINPAFAQPLPSHEIEEQAQKITDPGKIAYSLVSLLSVGFLSGMLATRIRTLSLNQWKTLNCLRSLILAIYILGISFVFSSAVLHNGFELTTPALCYTGILICLVFYFGGKVLLYVFLVERAYSIKSFEVKRLQSWVWKLGMLGIAIGFFPIGVAAFLNPIHDISPADGMCRIGLPLKITVPLLVYDVLMNISLTGVFYWLVRQFLPHGLLLASPCWVQRLALRIRISDPGDFQRMEQVAAIEKVVFKSFIGAVAIVVPTIANLALLYWVHGREQPWLCFTMCTIDVTWSALVLQWLTANPAELDGTVSGGATSTLSSSQSANMNSRMGINGMAGAVS
ncbi:hypothetical protein L228DRAFT_133148 [Xylona heveae TC161]|uniref:G-protein coupled receptors family 1 profile domain-containing protein n=1 Tax=Xylona heveae (strain CBS 132557 / TC161) TaxID=1328760 RepID=A0A165GW48_XYLHT|nr:hypothetical protein L228DRAFT_133148 [Xylona heveae TC161]KZF22673.1 hypothetical protein L228DRAFT_133148 [Xylona heveae TC161]